MTVGLNILTMSRSLDPLQLPSVPLTQRNHVPACSAIYFALDSSNRVLYVGKAKNLASRWKNHHRLHKLKEINQESPVRLAWQTWNEADLSAAEKSLIMSLQPLLNNTEVEAPAIVPSEVALRNFLKSFSRRLIIFGVEPKTTDRLLNVHLKYDWTDCSARGTAAKIKAYIQHHREQNTSLRFKWHHYSNFDLFAGEVFRPGSRAHRTRAREHRSFNNHWEFACNGVVMHITPVDAYQEYKQQTQAVKLAGVSLRAVTEQVFSQAQGNPYSEFAKLSCFTIDPIVLLWKNWSDKPTP